MSDQISTLPQIPAIKIRDIFAVHKILARRESFIILEVCQMAEQQPNNLVIARSPAEFRAAVDALSVGTEFAIDCQALRWIVVAVPGQDNDLFQAVQETWPGQAENWEYFPKLQGHADVVFIPNPELVELLINPELPSSPLVEEQVSGQAAPAGEAAAQEKSAGPEIDLPAGADETYLGLHLDGSVYILQKPNTTGSTAVIWQACMLPEPFEQPGLRLLEPGVETRQLLISLAKADRRYPKWEGAGSMMAIKIPHPGSEAMLEREALALRRLGPNVLRMAYPRQDRRDEFWSPAFPCLIMEWVTGAKLSESSNFNEPEGLEICQRLADLFYQIRTRAPEIVPTDSLKGDGIFIAGGPGSYSVRIIDWNVYVEKESAFKELTLIRLGEVLLGIFAPAMGFEVDRKANEVHFDQLAAGKPGSAAAQQWDRLSFGTRTLIRRLLERNFEGNADSIVQTFRSLVEDQAAAWKNIDPLGQARRSQSTARLNWLDIALGKGQKLDDQELADRDRALKDDLELLMKERRHLAAGAELRRALRLYPDDPYYRWAYIGNAAAQAAAATGQTQAFERLRLDETLNHLRNSRFIEAQAPLDWAATYLNSNRANFPQPTHDLLQALRSRVQIMVEAEGARKGLEERGRLQEAEAILAQAKEWNRQAHSSEQTILEGEDPACQKGIKGLQLAIKQHYSQYRQYEAGAKDASQLEVIRSEYFKRLLDYAADFEQQGGPDRPDLWQAALERYQLAMTTYPDQWAKDRAALEEKRAALSTRLANLYVEKAKNALGQENWKNGDAAVFLRQALQVDPLNPEAAGLEIGLSSFQLASQALRRGDPLAAGIYLEKVEQFVPIFKDRAAALHKLVELFERVDRCIRVCHDAHTLGTLSPALVDGKKLRAPLAEALADAQAEPEWQNSIKEKNSALERELDQGQSRFRELISASLSAWLGSRERDPLEIQARIKECGAEEMELGNLLRSASFLEQARLYLDGARTAAPDPQKAEECLKKAAEFQPTEPDQRLRQLDEQVSAAWLAYLAGLWKTTYQKVTRGEKIQASIEEGLSQIGSFPLLARLGPAHKVTEAEVRKAFVWLGATTANERPDDFAGILAQAESEDIRRVAKSMEAYAGKAPGYIQYLGKARYQTEKFATGSAAEMLRGALDFVWKEIFNNFNNAYTDLDPALAAAASMHALRQVTAFDSLTLAAAAVFTPEQAQKMLGAELALAPRPASARAPDPGLADFLEVVGDTMPEFKGLQDALRHVHPSLEQPIEKKKPAWIPWARAAGIAAIPVLLVLIALWQWPAISAALGMGPSSTPTVSVAVVSPTPAGGGVVVPATPTSTPTLTVTPTTTVTPSPTVTPTNTVTPTVTPVPVNVKFVCLKDNKELPSPIDLAQGNGIDCSFANNSSQKEKFSIRVFLVGKPDLIKYELSTEEQRNSFDVMFDVSYTKPKDSQYDLGEIEPNKSKLVKIWVVCNKTPANMATNKCNETTFAIDIIRTGSQSPIPNTEIKLHNYFGVPAAVSPEKTAPATPTATGTVTSTVTPTPK